MQNKKFGDKGEKIALEFLKGKGYEILETNWHYHHKEIDIIALKNRELIIVEVKTRSTDFFGAPYEFVDIKKQQFLIEAANGYLVEKNIDLPVRFDVISIILNNEKQEIHHVEDAFSP